MIQPAVTELNFRELAFWYPLLALWGGVLLHLLLPQPARALRQGWTLLASRLLARMLHAKNPPAQQRLSGALSWLLLLLPLLILLPALQILAWSEPMFDAVLLWLAFSWAALWPDNQRFARALQGEQKHLARTILNEQVQRDTTELSLLGLGKAGAETLLMGYLRGLIHVLFWYLLAGGCGALFYRCCELTARCWSPAQPKNHAFGLFAARMQSVLELPGNLLLLLLLLPGRHLRQRWQRMQIQAKGWSHWLTGALYTQVGLRLDIAMGGPVRYQGIRVGRPTLGGSRPVHSRDLYRLARDLNLYAFILLLLSSAGVLLR
ncbi:hypothetical protein C9E85_06475 [Plesiomonas shigelloides]|uniref:cobalamin biosynthesis protein n=1 Tax=Plesiomonas shigelloides TaxID=703 RepID=UPI000D5752BC|nr:cobalamin biosynthesis protein [Plesiomonas shigelloides]PVU66640.1 hypothetical protein C9E85_06475 [Plesiomonas shigelloides]